MSSNIAIEIVAKGKERERKMEKIREEMMHCLREIDGIESACVCGKTK